MLGELAKCCKPPDVFWPPPELLKSIEDAVMHLVTTDRKKPPSPAWKALKLLNRRMSSLRLTLRLDNVVKHARELLEKIGESPLQKLARQDHEDARKLLRDLEHLRTNVSSAKAIDWSQHEKALAEFSRTRTVELASNQAAPVPVRCYARALELLLLDEYRHKPLQRKAAPFLEWLARIKHPQAKTLLEFDRVTASRVTQQEAASRENKAWRLRQQQRERTRRHREWHRGTWVYPGDWLQFRNAVDFAKFYGRKHPLPKTCTGLEDSPCRAWLETVLDSLLCNRALADEPYWYYHRTRQVARCYDCQDAEWLAEGYVVTRPGHPSPRSIRRNDKATLEA